MLWKGREGFAGIWFVPFSKWREKNLREFRGFVKHSFFKVKRKRFWRVFLGWGGVAGLWHIHFFKEIFRGEGGRRVASASIKSFVLLHWAREARAPLCTRAQRHDKADAKIRKHVLFRKARAPRRAFSFKTSSTLYNDKRSCAFFGKDVTTVSHENTKCLSQKENKSWNFKPLSTHQTLMKSAKEWKCECNNILSKTETSLLKSIWIALVKRNSSTRSKIIKVCTQTDVCLFCARTLICFWRKLRLFGWGQFHLKSTILKFLAHWFWSKVSFHLEEKKTWFCKLSFFCSFFTTAEKNARWNQKFQEKNFGEPRLP